VVKEKMRIGWEGTLLRTLDLAFSVPRLTPLGVCGAADSRFSAWGAAVGGLLGLFFGLAFGNASPRGVADYFFGPQRGDGGAAVVGILVHIMLECGSPAADQARSHACRRSRAASSMGALPGADVTPEKSVNKSAAPVAGDNICS
jgi:hypothetical protein